MEFSKRDIRTWSMVGPSGILGLAACELADINPEFVVLTADLCNFSGLDRFRTQFPERLINVGIAEQNMIGMAGGLAKEGMVPFATTYATFASTRVLDQVKVNMGYMRLPIKLIGLTSGYSTGILGATHMSIEDIAIMRSIPNVIVLSPADCTETMKALLSAAEVDAPVYIRMSGFSRSPVVYKEDYPFEIGKAVKVRDGTVISLFATGTMVYQCMKAAEDLQEKGLSCDVIDIHTIKPIDTVAIQAACKKKLIVSVEEHSCIGGLGAAIAEIIAPLKNKPPQLMIGISDEYQHAASYETQIKRSGLTAEQICKTIFDYCEENIL